MKTIKLFFVSFLFITVFSFSFVHASTFVFIDKATYALGGSGFNNRPQGDYTVYIIGTDKETYNPGDTVYNTFLTCPGGKNCYEESVGDKLLYSSPNFEKHFVSNESYSDNTWANRSFRLYVNPFYGQVNLYQNGSESGYFIKDYNNDYQPGTEVFLYPYIDFNFTSANSTSPANCANTPTTTTQTLNGTWRRVLVGNYVRDNSSWNGYGYTYTPGGEKYITYLDISPNNYNGNSFFLWNQHSQKSSSLPSTMTLSTANNSASNIRNLIGQSSVCSFNGNNCLYYDDYAADTSRSVNSDTVWYFSDGMHPQQTILLDLSNSKLDEGPSGYIGGSLPSGAGSMTYTSTYTTTINTCSSIPSIYIR